jgi:citrate synthase
MSILRTGVSLLSHVDTDCEDNSSAAELQKSMRLLAQIPTLIGICQRSRENKPILEPDATLSHAANLLWLINGRKPSELEARIMDVSLMLYAEHDFNASTFACRVIASTESDLHSAICGGIGALKGPLHGGANQAVIEMLEKIQSEGGDLKRFVEMAKSKDNDFRLSGFGHRVYKKYDPRALILKKVAEDVMADMNRNDPLLDLAKELEEIALADDYFIENRLYPNVDFYSGFIYRAMGFPTNMFTVLFAMGRLPGWIAHWKEMRENPRTKIGRPRQIYIGETERKYTPLDQRI